MVRASAGLLTAAIAISCSHDDDQPVVERAAAVAQALGTGGAAGAPDVAAGAPPVAGNPPGAAGAGGADTQPPPECTTDQECVTAHGGDCWHCDTNAGACLKYTLLDDHECRAAASDCELHSICLGGDSCPATNIAKLEFTPCGSNSNVACDAPDSCDDKGKCVDRVKDTTVDCRAATGAACDLPEKCDGMNHACPTTPRYKDKGTPCRGKQGDCDAADTCTGGSEDCPDTPAADGTVCTDSTDLCLVKGTTTCLNGKCAVGTAVTCGPPPSDCSQAGVCDSKKGCQYAAKPDGAACSDDIACSVGDSCQAGTCVSGTPTDKECPPQPICATVHCDLSAKQLPDRCRVDIKDSTTKCRLVVVGDVCDKEERCNGVDAECPKDDKLPMGTVCSPASCVNFKEQPAVLCDGENKKCPAVAATSCLGYACGGDNTCRKDCDTDNDCDAQNYYCVNHVCEQRTGAGEKCNDDSECSKSNPHCVDGVCCNTVCTGQCEACDVTDKVGTCSLVTGAPHGDRTACRGDGSACSGSCGGKLRSSCEFPKPTTVCVDAACDPKRAEAVEQAFCDGAGSCASTDPMPCTPYTCGATACRGDCVSDAQCATGSFCKAGVCTGLQKPGEKCARDGQCQSGFCTDGVCCDGRCDGQCEACGKTGKCEAVTGKPAGTRKSCFGLEGEACTGLCDGKSRAACAYPSVDTSCRDASCTAGTATIAAHCTGGGFCGNEQTVTCKNGCEGTICAGDACQLSTDCKSGERCLAGMCVPQGNNGDTCSTAGDCGSGFCVDGVCCDKACDGQCEACDNAGKAGTCSATMGAPHGARAQCNGDGSACTGQCDGKTRDACDYPTDVSCGTGSCTPGEGGAEAVATVEPLCNGSGRCPAPREQACGAAGCDAKQKQCAGECADGSACPQGQYCSAGVCIAQQPTGTACQAAGDCDSGFCVDGYCCGSACDDRCAACDVPGALGECTAVSGATHGSRAGCQGGGVCGAHCDGEDTKDCNFATKGTSCAEPYCSSGTQVSAASCDGAGQCAPGEQMACASLACDGAACSDSCKTDADCSRTMQCHEGKCTEPFKINAVDEGTCGCRVPGGKPRSDAAWLALAGLAFAGLRRRGSRRAA